MQVEAPDECENHRSLKRERGVGPQHHTSTNGLSSRRVGGTCAGSQPLARASGFYRSESFFLEWGPAILGAGLIPFSKPI